MVGEVDRVGEEKVRGEVEERRVLQRELRLERTKQIVSICRRDHKKNCEEKKDKVRGLMR